MKGEKKGRSISKRLPAARNGKKKEVVKGAL